ncbi:MAG: mRNA-degrading endonuclease [Ignavibacteria bacterium GWB2_35_6b]|nr:MAG: mRNA-degrading endonuclease [Ignavibacteria bacterium GWB2_35_6b]
MPVNYIPERGDIVWLNFTPQAGHEQKGKRPAVVLSPKLYNEKTGLALFCPITSVQKNYPFEIELPSNNKITGVILADQVKSLDWKSRDVKFIDKIKPALVNELREKLSILIL